MLQRLNLILGIVSFIGLLAVLTYILITPQKLVYVDSAKLLNNYKGMTDARDAYQKKAASWKANVDTLTQEVQKQIMDYERGSSRMTAKERQLTEELIRTKQKQLIDYQQALNNQAQQEDAKMTGEVITQVNAYLKKYGESKGYQIIMAATEYGNIAYANEALDVTDEVLEGLNQEYAGK